MLTGDTVATGGDAIVGSHSVSESMGPIQQSFGYCPQVDALINPLTGRQHLTLYCRLRGLPSAEVREGGREEGREGGREGGRKGGREGEREREREREREGGGGGGEKGKENVLLLTSV